MHITYAIFLRVLALVLFLLGAVPASQPNWRGWNLVSAGLFCWCLSAMF